MPKFIAIVNMKGGVAKTTTAFNLSHAIATQGKRVLAVDLDHQATLTYLFGHDEEVLERAEKTIHFSLVKGKPFSEILIPGNPALIPSSHILFSVDWDLMAQQSYSNMILRLYIQEIQAEYDYVLYDCPPAPTILTSSAIANSDFVIVPVKTDILSIRGISSLFDHLEEVKVKYNPKLSVLGILPTVYNSTFNNDKEALRTLQWISETKHVPLLEPIPRSTLYDRAAVEITPVVLKKNGIPGADVFRKITEIIINHE